MFQPKFMNSSHPLQWVLILAILCFGQLSAAQTEAKEHLDHSSEERRLAAPENAIFFEWNGGFGRSYSTDGDGSREAFSFELAFGSIRSSHIWNRWQPSLVFFSRQALTDDRRLKVPYGLAIKFATSYRLGAGHYASLAAALGFGQGAYWQTIDQEKVRASGTVTPQILQASFSSDYALSDTLDFQSGFSINHFFVPIQAGRLQASQSQGAKKARTEHLNTYEVNIGLRYKYPTP